MWNAGCFASYSLNPKLQGPVWLSRTVPLRPVVRGVGMLRGHGQRVSPGHGRLRRGIADSSAEDS